MVVHVGTTAIGLEELLNHRLTRPGPQRHLQRVNLVNRRRQ